MAPSCSELSSFERNKEEETRVPGPAITGLCSIPARSYLVAASLFAQHFPPRYLPVQSLSAGNGLPGLHDTSVSFQLGFHIFVIHFYYTLELKPNMHGIQVVLLANGYTRPLEGDASGDWGQKTSESNPNTWLGQMNQTGSELLPFQVPADHLALAPFDFAWILSERREVFENPHKMRGFVLLVSH